MGRSVNLALQENQAERAGVMGSFRFSFLGLLQMMRGKCGSIGVFMGVLFSFKKVYFIEQQFLTGFHVCKSLTVTFWMFKKYVKFILTFLNGYVIL